MNRYLSKQNIQELEDLIKSDLSKNYGSSSGGLQMPGFETLIILFAKQILIPIVTSLSSSIIYGKLKKERDTEKAIKIILETPISNSLVIPKEELIQEILEQNKDLALSKEKTEELVNAVLTKLNSK